MVWRRDAPLALLAAEADGPRCCGDFNPPTLPRGGGRSPLPHRDHVRGRSTCRSARTANLALSCARTLGWAWAAANLRGSAPRFARIVPIRQASAGRGLHRMLRRSARRACCQRARAIFALWACNLQLYLDRHTENFPRGSTDTLGQTFLGRDQTWALDRRSPVHLAFLPDCKCSSALGAKAWSVARLHAALRRLSDGWLLEFPRTRCTGRVTVM